MELHASQYYTMMDADRIYRYKLARRSTNVFERNMVVHTLWYSYTYTYTYGYLCINNSSHMYAMVYPYIIIHVVCIEEDKSLYMGSWRRNFKSCIEELIYFGIFVCTHSYITHTPRRTQQQQQPPPSLLCIMMRNLYANNGVNFMVMIYVTIFSVVSMLMLCVTWHTSTMCITGCVCVLFFL